MTDSTIYCDLPVSTDDISLTLIMALIDKERKQLHFFKEH